METNKLVTADFSVAYAAIEYNVSKITLKKVEGTVSRAGWAFDAINGRSKPEQAPYWLIDVSCIFLSFPLITSGVYGNCVVIKVDWLAACIALRVVGTVIVIFLQLWHTIYTVLQSMGSKG